MFHENHNYKCIYLQNTVGSAFIRGANRSFHELVHP